MSGSSNKVVLKPYLWLLIKWNRPIEISLIRALFYKTQSSLILSKVLENDFWVHISKVKDSTQVVQHS